MNSHTRFKRYVKNDPGQKKEIRFLPGTKLWYLNGNIHREDGCAVQIHDGRNEWWLEGKLYFRIETFLKALKEYKEKNR